MAFLPGIRKSTKATNSSHQQMQLPCTVLWSYWRQVAGRKSAAYDMVGEGETLHTISDKCGDPYIVERNPHIHDPDDVFPGLVIKITPRNRS
ncbi:hypothetical protein HAX54_003687 [Datura stramonium]|uniref:LysM domain-containing protein n=1 Tax=Datura stramonium TaxID=4076 RepID=A0ABS8RTH9_DATST|nr:hypothetical protein [Datura stramonium]